MENTELVELGPKPTDRLGKICRGCNEFKLYTEYHISQHQKGGFNNYCKPCRSLKDKAKYRRNLFHSIFILKRSFCKTRSIPFNLDEKYLESIWTDTCPVLGYSLVIDDKSNSGQYSLDRLRPKLGYTKGNVKFISSRANRIKYDATIEELELVLDYMKREGCN